jgi:hypothetical protein
MKFPALYYYAQERPPLDLVLSQMNPVHILWPYFFKIQSNIILASVPRAFKFSDQHSVRMTPSLPWVQHAPSI